MAVLLYLIFTCANNLCNIVVKNLMLLVMAMFRLAQVLMNLLMMLELYLMVLVRTVWGMCGAGGCHIWSICFWLYIICVSRSVSHVCILLPVLLLMAKNGWGEFRVGWLYELVVDDSIPYPSYKLMELWKVSSMTRITFVKYQDVKKVYVNWYPFSIENHDYYSGMLWYDVVW